MKHISLLPATMLSFASRGHWWDSGGKMGFSSQFWWVFYSCACGARQACGKLNDGGGPTWLPQGQLSNTPVNNSWQISTMTNQWPSWLPKLNSTLHGSFPENSISTPQQVISFPPVSDYRYFQLVIPCLSTVD